MAYFWRAKAHVRRFVKQDIYYNIFPVIRRKNYAKKGFIALRVGAGRPPQNNKRKYKFYKFKMRPPQKGRSTTEDEDQCNS